MWFLLRAAMVYQGSWDEHSVAAFGGGHFEARKTAREPWFTSSLKGQPPGPQCGREKGVLWEGNGRRMWFTRDSVCY